MAPGTALALFFVYSAINGLTLATIFLIYSLGTIYLAFGSTAITFAILSIIGFTTKQDLSNWGSYLMMGLVGLIIASVANFFFASTMLLDTIITYAGLLLFLSLTVYDTQRIKKMTSQAILSGQDQVVARIGVLGALRLYLDFINMFLFILRLLGRRR
jgi:FtsH-binding integral membrane protein